MPLEGESQPVPWLCSSSHAKTHHLERRGGRKKDQEGEEIESFIKASYFKAVQLKCSPLV